MIIAYFLPHYTSMEAKLGFLILFLVYNELLRDFDSRRMCSLCMSYDKAQNTKV